jgi:serine/threonine protein kinase/Tfp pilus assembly protein PilF
VIGQTVSHYRILEKLGQGGMGVVYLAEDTHLGRRVAIKFLSHTDHHYRARFLREARAVSALTHSNIATVFDYGETADKQPYIVMELIKGKTVSDLLQGQGLTLAQAVEIVSSVAEALAEAHHHGIVHRDIKPSNVVVNERGQVKVLDFGLVKQLMEATSQSVDQEAQTLFSTRTRSDVIVGTPLYLSPEQASGKSVDGRSDLFSLGALLYECIAGQSAFSGASVLEIGAQVIHVNPPPPSTINPAVPPQLDRIAMKALEKNVEARYQSAEEMLRDLRTVLASLSSDGQRTQIRSARETPPSRRLPTGALNTLTQTLSRPRLSLATFAIAIILTGVAIWAAIHWWPVSLHKPPAAATDWYNRGTDALRNGAYYGAKKSLDQAIVIDDKFALAHARLAEALSELDYADQAKDELLRVAALVPDRSVLPRPDGLYLEAINSVVSRDFASAIKAYSEIARQLPNEAQVYVDLGRAYEKNNEPDKAIVNYVKATTIDGQYATGFLRAGMLYSRKRDTTNATAALDKAEKLYTALNNIEGVNEVTRQRGILLRDIGKYDDARLQFERALEAARTIENEPQQVSALIQLSFLSYKEGAPAAKAQEYARKALELAQQKHLDSLATAGLIELGNASFQHGDLSEAEEYFTQAINSARTNRTRLQEARGMLNLGQVYVRQLRTDEGLDLAQRALSFFQQGNYRADISACLTTIGRANRRKGDYQAARKAFQQKLQLAQETNEQPQIAVSYGEIGAVLFEEERYSEALEQYEKAYAINKSIGNRLNLAFNQANRGDILWRLGRYDEAGLAFSEALAIAKDSGFKDLPIEIQRCNAQIALSERHFPDAKLKSEETLKLAGEQYKNVTIEAKYTLGLAKTFSGSGREGTALCEDAVKMATDAGDTALLSRAMLALAESLLESGDARAALEQATKVQQRLAQAGQQESEWRARLIAARASRRLSDAAAAEQELAHAKEILSQLLQKWGAEVFNRYLTRPDVQVYYKQLG